MSQTMLEGNLQQITERQLHFVKDVLEKQGFGDAKVELHTVGKPGDNYGAIVKKVVAEKDNKQFKMFAKLSSQSEQLRQALKVDRIFENEQLMYLDLLPKLSEYEDNEHLHKEEKLKYPVCYGALMEKPHEIIILEDLQNSGFEMLDRFNYLTDNEIKLVLKDLSKLHSFSYVLKYREPEIFNQLKDKLFDMWINMDSDFENMLVQLEKNTMALLNKDEHKKVLKAVMASKLSIYKKLHNVDSVSRYSIIAHGDIWANNVMFKLEDGKPTKCCLVDYQMSRLNSPVADVVYLIFTSTDYKCRKIHFYDWIDYYHTNLSNRLSDFGLLASYVYPRDQLDADLRRHGKSSLCTAIMHASISLQQGAAAVELKEMMENGMFNEAMDKTNEDFEPEYLTKFKARVEGLIDSHVEYGLV